MPERAGRIGGATFREAAPFYILDMATATRRPFLRGRIAVYRAIAEPRLRLRVVG